LKRFFLLFLFAFFEFAYGGRDPSVSFVSTGQGNCTIVDCGNDDRLVIDCGFSQAPADIIESVDVEFSGKRYAKPLKKETIDEHKRVRRKELIRKRLSSYTFPNREKTVVVISHSDDDHLNLIKDLLKSTTPSTFILGGPAGDYFKKDHTRTLINDFKRSTIVFLSHHLTASDIQHLLTLAKDSPDIDNYLDQKPLRGHLLKKSLNDIDGLNLTVFCPRLDLEIISANAGQGIMIKGEQSFPVIINDDSNMNSVVLKVTNRASQQSAILTGDATGITTNQAIRYYENSSAAPIPELGTDIMLACHHGANTHESNNKRWVDITSPRATIFSCGKKEKYWHPQCDVVDRYKEKAMSGISSHFLTCGRDESFGLPEPLTKAVYSTHDSGTITATFEADKIMMEVGEGSFYIPRTVSAPLPPMPPVSSTLTAVRYSPVPAPATRPSASVSRVLTFGSQSPFSPGASSTIVLDSTRKRHVISKRDKSFGSPSKRNSDLSSQMKREIGNIIGQLNTGVSVDSIRSRFSVDELKIINAHKDKSVDEIIRILDRR